MKIEPSEFLPIGNEFQKIFGISFGKFIDMRFLLARKAICGAVHPRDLFAAENILRQGIAELGSGSKPSEQSQGCSHVSHPTIPCK